MSLKGKTLLKGHTLRYEGDAFADLDNCADCHPGLGRWDARNGPGHGRCSCGEYGPHQQNRAQRKRWHREHKEAVRGPSGR